MAGPAAVNEHSPFKIAKRPPKKANARIGLKFGLQFFFFVFCMFLCFLPFALCSCRCCWPVSGETNKVLMSLFLVVFRFVRDSVAIQRVE